MVVETMSPNERIEAAVNLEEVDRTPISLAITSAFLARNYGVKLSDIYKDPLKGLELELKFWDEVGGWDARNTVLGYPLTPLAIVNVPSNPALRGFVAVPPSPVERWGFTCFIPGINFPEDRDIQFEEPGILKEEDYDKIVEVGWEEFFLELIRRLTGKEVTKDMMNEEMKAWGKFSSKIKEIIKQKGIENFLIFAPVGDPLVTLSVWRDHIQFAIDLKRRYEKVKAAVEVITECHLDYFKKYIKLAHEIEPHVRNVNIGSARTTIRFLGRKRWEELAWPWIRDATKYVLSLGLRPVFHLDGRFLECLPYFKEEFPERKCIFWLDNNTDIFKAKEILRGWGCLYGGLTPSIVSFGSPQDIVSYCKKIIDVLGKDSGFIFSCACYIAPTAKAELVKLAVRIAKTHKPPK